jgi:hypothetical protein
MHPLLKALKTRGSIVETAVPSHTLLTGPLSERHPSLPQALVEFLSSLAVCANPEENSWFLTFEDYARGQAKASVGTNTSGWHSKHWKATRTRAQRSRSLGSSLPAHAGGALGIRLPRGRSRTGETRDGRSWLLARMGAAIGDRETRQGAGASGCASSRYRPLANGVLTPGAERALCYAREEAEHFDCPYVSTPYLLLGLLREHEGHAAVALAEAGVELGRLREWVAEDPLR